MGHDYSKYSREQLTAHIAELEKQLKSQKYGLYWDKSIEQEEVVQKCIDNIPILIREDKKTIFTDGLNNNILIEGDNFHALTSLKMLAGNKGIVDMIYIDPPYNTGHEDFAYNDKYVGEDDGFYHSKWLSFMEKRLILAKSLLKNTGCIFISIDDNEQANLKLLCDKIFGSNNFVNNFIVTSAPAGTQSSVDVAIQHSYCLCYKKPQCKLNTLITSEEELDNKYDCEDENGKYYTERIWKRGVGGRKEDVPSLHFPVYFDEKNNIIYIDEDVKKAPNKNELIKIIPYQTKGVLGRWTWSREKMHSDYNLLTVKKTSGEYKLFKKMYKSEDKGKKPFSIIGSDIGRTELGSLELKDILNKKTFSYPKPNELIKYFVQIGCPNNGIVLDFFAGSGTTGQSVMELNDNKTNRRFILCTNNENNICEEVTYNRLKTIITGKRIDKTKYSDGIPNNLIYYKTSFIKNSPNSDQAKYSLVEKTNELLCIKENIFELDKENSNNVYYHYLSECDNKHLFIYTDIYDKEMFNRFVKLINSTKGNKIVYIYSNDNLVDENRTKDIKALIKPIPSKIYEIYKEIVEGIKEDL